MDATAPPELAQPDGVRHESDGDTHGWLRVDPAFASVINAGNTADQHGNLVFEIVCHFSVTQPDAKRSCRRFTDHTTIPPIGSHVAIRGTLVTAKNHGQWNEIHPTLRTASLTRPESTGASEGKGVAGDCVFG